MARQGTDFREHSVHEIHDRRNAITICGSPRSLEILLALQVKVMKNYQEADGVRHWFDDVVEVQSAINAQPHSVIQLILQLLRLKGKQKRMHTSTTSTRPNSELLDKGRAITNKRLKVNGDNHTIPTAKLNRTVSPDLRHAEAGDVFPALQARAFDAHNFAARAAGARL